MRKRRRIETERRFEEDEGKKKKKKRKKKKDLHHLSRDCLWITFIEVCSLKSIEVCRGFIRNEKHQTIKTLSNELSRIME